MVKIKKFDLDESVVAKNIYGDYSHNVIETGVETSNDVKVEIQKFLCEFLKFCNYSEQGIYFRIDAFLDPEGKLQIIEINSHFVDGWGTALNLARSAGYKVDISNVKFPSLWTCEDNIYLPELELACQELNLLGHDCRTISKNEALSSSEEVYWYGRFRESSEHPNIYPAHGYELDNKMNLALLSEQWKGKNVQIPKFFYHENIQWEDLPENIIFKLCDKSENERASVMFRNQIGQGKKMRKRYNSGKVIAQKLVESCRLEDKNVTQLIIMTAGTTPVTGYLQSAWEHTRIINDDSKHGPLIFL